ncbi:MAG: gliding motility-associated C-terminal domain-containing protein [Bacteroidota bacterium]
MNQAIIYPNNYLMITNRWGNIVYEEHFYRNTFDGQNLPDGVYFYTFWHDYQNNPGEKKEGFFHIVR